MGTYIWRGDLIEGFLLYEDLIHGLLSPQTSFGFVHHAFISLSSGRNECVTNKPQRTSVGRLIHGGAYFWNFMVFVIFNNYIPVALFSNVTAFRIALIQLAVSSNKSQNLLRAKEKIKAAVSNGAKVVALPVRILFDNFKLICLHSEACYPYNLTVQCVHKTEQEEMVLCRIPPHPIHHYKNHPLPVNPLPVLPFGNL